MYSQFTTESAQKQAKKILQKLAYYKVLNGETCVKLREIEEKTLASKLTECGTSIALAQDENDMIRIRQANFCRERICYVCAWRRQAKFVATTIPVLDQLEKDYSFIFVGLTVRNCTGDKISENLQLLLSAWSKFRRLKKVASMNVGFIRSLEITYNEESNTYHPHIHALLVVRKDYFTDPNQYIEQQELIGLWRNCLGVEYDPDVDIRKVRNKKDKSGSIEVLKYSIKPQKCLNAEQFKHYIYDLKGKRLIAFGGIVAKMKKLNLDDLVDVKEIRSCDKVTLLMKFDVNGGIYKTKMVL